MSLGARASACLLSGCLVLASSTHLIQQSPQRVERRQEWRRCVVGEFARMEKVTTMVIDGRAVEPRTETLVTLYEYQSRPEAQP